MKNSPRTLLIVGRGKSAIPLPASDMTWTFLSAANADEQLASRAHAIWDCHGGEVIEPASHVDTAKLYDFRSELRVRAYFDKTGRRYSNQLCWMLALAGDHYEAGIFGALLLYRMPFDEEKLYELPYVMWHLGRLHAIGMPVVIEPGSYLEIPQTYGVAL